jgi:PEP-CTERM motif
MRLSPSRLRLAAAIAASLICAAPAFADTATVDSTTDIWLAGQPAGSTVTGFFGSDVAPDNSPVRLTAAGGSTFRFLATGSTSVDASCFDGPDGGGCYPDESSFGVGPANGIGTYKGPADALIGVFLSDDTPSGSGGPASLDFTDPAVAGAAGFTPLLNQIFFIGDGLAGDGVSAQTFLAPTGSTRLFLAVADSFGSSTGNLGSLAVTYSSTAGGAAPEPASWALMIAGFGLAGAALRRRRAATLA